MSFVHRRQGRSWGHRIVVGCAAVAVAVAAVPAFAEPSSGSLFVSVGAATVGGEGAPGKAIPMFVSNLGATEPTAVFDMTELSGIVTVELDEEFCTVSGTQGRCRFPDDPDVHGYSLVLPLLLRPADGVIAGASGTLTWRVSAANGGGPEGFAVISVADGVDLVVLSTPQEIDHARPGQETVVTIPFVNAGNEAAPQVQLIVTSTSGLDLTQFEECEYTQDQSVRTAVCLIDVTLQPDERLEVDFGFTPNTSGLDEDFGYFVAVPGTVQLPVAGSVKPRRDAGRSLPVRKVAPALTAAEIDRNDNRGGAQVLVDNTADLAVSGATLQGAQGDVVEAQLAVSNLGPATVRDRFGEVGAAIFEFVVPDGTEVVGVPEDCFSTALWRETGHQQPVPGAPQYTCGSGVTFPQGMTMQRTFRVKITEVMANAEGQVQTFAGPEQIVPTYDDKPANNTARVIVNPASGGSGGGLPVTGAPLGLIAWAGVVLLGAGGGLLLLSRRRRISPVAGDGAA